MCGICGTVGKNLGKEIVQRMTQAMIHRGPDNEGYLDGGDIKLGMRRLGIIDLSTGDQPIFNEDRTVAIVFNGEIYNFQELYAELLEKGHHFNTQSDTETIVHAYEEWGTDCPSHLRGMFAIAIYDHRPRLETHARLFLARDRLGIKPLYVWQSPNRLAFASEVRALLAGELPQRKLSSAGLYTYLLFGSVQEPLTLIEGITSLPPASWLEVSCAEEGLRIKRGCYWTPPTIKPMQIAAEQVHEWLAEAVEKHLVSDVPLGAFLSGGLDSGTIVALASQAQTKPLQTFTLAFDDWPADERNLAQVTANRWKTTHHTRLITQQEILADLPQALSSMDQPTMDGVNSWYVSREAKMAGLTVALSGVGGDELFAGYPAFRQVHLLKHIFFRIPFLRWLPGMEDGLPWLPGNRDLRRKLLALLSGDMPLRHPYFSVRGLFNGPTARGLMAGPLWENLQEEKKGLTDWLSAVQVESDRSELYDSVGSVSWLEMTQYMRSTLLRDTDMMSMAHSLEVRVPYVDHLLVERVLPISHKQKMIPSQQKPLLVEAMDGELPEEITRLKKRTFTLPFELWLRNELSHQVKNVLLASTPKTNQWLNPTTTRKVWVSFERGETSWARPWALYVLKNWLSRNL